MKTTLPILIALALVTVSGCGLLKKREPIHQNVNGAIAQGDRVLEDDNSLYDDFPIDVEQGWTIHATLRSSEFDSYLILKDPAGSAATQNDDDATLGGKGTDSQITFTATQSGVYHVLANAYKAGEKGAYQLAIEAGPAGSITPPAAAAAAQK